jgi:phage shock protein C
MYKSLNDRVLTGVCGGIGEYFSIPSVFIRLAFAVAFAFFGAGLLLYILLFLVMSNEPS